MPKLWMVPNRTTIAFGYNICKGTYTTDGFVAPIAPPAHSVGAATLGLNPAVAAYKVAVVMWLEVTVPAVGTAPANPPRVIRVTVGTGAAPVVPFRVVSTAKASGVVHSTRPGP